MTTPSLPQHDDAQRQAARAAELAAAQTTYGWAHQHTYDRPGQTPLVLEPIAILAVDKDHPFPANQNPTFVQVVEIGTTLLALIGNIIVSLTNLRDVGAVALDEPTSNSTSESKGLLGKVRQLGKSVVHAGERVLDVAGDALELGADASKGLAALLAELGEHHKRGQALIEKARTSMALGDAGPKSSGFAEIAAELGQLVKDLLETLLKDAFEAVLGAAGLSGKATRIQAYADQFQTLVVPNVVSTTLSDACFARMRVAGPNPLLITKISAFPAAFPVDRERFRAISGQDPDAALASGRVYLVDYAALEGATPSSLPAGPKYLSAPFALFVLGEDRRVMAPLAIQCSQQPGHSNPIFYADDGESWELAKLHVQSADGNYHELISHLGLTHLLVEPFVVAAHRQLAVEHPLMLLLLPHFQGTLFINDAAINTLIAPGGVVDQLLGATIESDWKISATALGQLDFRAHMLPAELAARGVDDPAIFPNYPYRDDALLVWRAIEAWVRDYLGIYYNDDADVAGDTELQAWIADVSSPEGGTVQGIGEVLRFDTLVELVTMVIFTGSAQHASVNFPQLDIMSYTPAMPLATYAPPPTHVSAPLPSTTELNHLPPLQMALLQVIVGQLLGGIYFTRLGQYDRHQPNGWFSDPRVTEPLAAFQSNLDLVERTIGARNLERPVYSPLLPSRIPQSINI